MLKCRAALPLVVFASAFLFSGCVVVREYPAQESVAKAKEPEIELARKLIKAFVSNDAGTFVSLLPEETRSKFNEESFAKSRKQIVDSVGEPVSFTYMTSLELPALTPQIWKIRFSRINLKKDQEFTSEILFKVVTGMTGKKEAVITSFQFI